MKRRSKASSKSAKARPNKSSTLPRRPRQRPLAKSGSAPSAPEPEVAQLKQDLHIALEQQAATSEALRIIASSPSELQPVFDALLANATRLCEASYGTLWLHENDGQMRIAALHGASLGVFVGNGASVLCFARALRSQPRGSFKPASPFKSLISKRTLPISLATPWRWPR
jgi:hypothetical protein